jgi:HlyD family secretion protein
MSDFQSDERKRGRFMVIMAIVLVLGGSMAFWKMRGKAKPKEEFRALALERGDITMSVTATGTVSAVTTVQVGSQVSGVISRLYADFNSPVKKGQLLAELDTTPFQAQAEQRSADLRRAQVERANAAQNYNRQKRLVESGLISAAELDNAKAALDSASALVDQSAASLRQAQTNLHYAKISSPIDGVVVERKYDIGQTVAASFQAPTLFTIAQDLTKMQVQADIDQADIGRLRVGQDASFTVDAYPEQTFEGHIKEIRLNATTNQNVVTYPVIIEVENRDNRLRPNMTADVTIAVAEAKDVLRLPNAALRFKPDAEGGDAQRTGSATSSAAGGQQMRRNGGGGNWKQRRGAGQTVYILGPDGKPQPRHVMTGITDGRFTEVSGGELKDGDKVIVGKATAKVEDNGRPPGMGGPGMGGGRAGGGRTR